MNDGQKSIQWRYADKELAMRSAEVVRTLVREGYEAYWVGGCVRDEYMGRPVSDMDITTSATPETTVSLFPKVIPTGIQHGTVTVVMGGQTFEVTTFRVERGYEDHRHPAEVAFVEDVKEDLRRRDFTMNAMAVSIDGTWVDPFGGRDDIDRKIIRCVGNPALRFREDALRMVRCIRFASVFGFSIAFQTWRGIMAERDTLPWIAMERIRTEIEKMLMGPSPLAGLHLFLRSGLYARMKVPFPYEGHDDRIASAIPLVAPELPSVRWSTLLLACGIRSFAADGLLREWTFSNRQREAIIGLLSLHEAWQRISNGSESEPEDLQLAWVRLALSYGESTAMNWLKMMEALQEAGAVVTERQETRRLSEWLGSMRLRSLKELAVTGSELLEALGRRGGSWLGRTLGYLLELAAAGRINNDKLSLIEEAKRVVMNHEGS